MDPRAALVVVGLMVAGSALAAAAEQSSMRVQGLLKLMAFDDQHHEINVTVTPENTPKTSANWRSLKERRFRVRDAR